MKLHQKVALLQVAFLAMPVALLLGYLVSLGPVYYLEVRFMAPASPVLTRFYRPAELVSRRFKPYYDYLHWCVSKAIDDHYR